MRAAIAQQVERVLGKDEVPSSNLGSSSKKSSNFSYERLKLELFLCKKLELVVT